MRVAGAGNIFTSHMGELFQGMDDKQASNIIQQASEIICNILKTEQSVAHGTHNEPRSSPGQSDRGSHQVCQLWFRLDYLCGGVP
jgi:hypothetical protein